MLSGLGQPVVIVTSLMFDYQCRQVWADRLGEEVGAGFGGSSGCMDGETASTAFL